MLKMPEYLFQNILFEYTVNNCIINNNFNNIILLCIYILLLLLSDYNIVYT